MKEIPITEAMLGTREPDLVRYPEVDVFGKEYKRGEVSVRNVGLHQFVVIPSALDGPDKWKIINPFLPKTDAPVSAVVVDDRKSKS